MPALQFATGVQPVLSQSACSSSLFDQRAGRSPASRSGSASLFPERLRPVEAVLQHLNQINHVSWRWRSWRFRSDLFVLRLLFDDLHQCRPVFVPIFLRLPGNIHALDERLRHFQFLVADGCTRAVLQDLGAQNFAGKVHQLQNQEQAVGFHRSKMFAITDHNFRNTNLSCAAQRLVQNCIGFLPTFLRLQEIWPVEKLRIHLFQTHEIGDVDRMRGFDPHLLEILILQDNIPAALILEAFYDLVAWNFLGVRLGNFFVSDWAEVARTQLPKADLFLACGRINGHGDINQPKADAAFPDGAHMGFEPLFHTATMVCQPSGRLAWPAVKEAAHQIALQLLETA